MYIKKARFCFLIIGMLTLVFGIGSGTISSQATGTIAGDITIAVTSFENNSNSSLINVGNGAADLLIGKLVEGGFNVVERTEIDSILLERNLNPAIPSDITEASLYAGADLLLRGSINSLDIVKTKVSLGFLTVSGAEVSTNLSFRLISPYTTEVMAVDSVEAKGSGQTGFSFDVGKLINMSSSAISNVCMGPVGALRSDRNTYYQGQSLTFGFRDAIPGSWRELRITGPSCPGWSCWLGWQLSNQGACACCAIWSWTSPSLSPGTYTAREWTTGATTTFTVAVGTGPPGLISEFTVGTKQFMDTIAGQVLDEGLDKVVTKLSAILPQITPQIISQREAYQGEEPSETLKCKVLDVENSTVLIGGINGTCGEKAGVKENDLFSVYTAKQVIDPNSGELIEVIPLEDQPKGTIIVTQVFDSVSRAQKIGSFNIQQGDLVVRKEG